MLSKLGQKALLFKGVKIWQNTSPNIRKVFTCIYQDIKKRQNKQRINFAICEMH